MIKLRSPTVLVLVVVTPVLASVVEMIAMISGGLNPSWNNPAAVWDDLLQSGWVTHVGANIIFCQRVRATSATRNAARMTEMGRIVATSATHLWIPVGRCALCAHERP